MSKTELIMAIEQLCDEKNIPFEAVVDSIEAALAVAYRKEFGNKNLNARVEFNPEDGSMRIFDVKEVVADPTEEELAELERQEKEREERLKAKREGLPVPKREEEELEEGEEEERRFNPRTDIPITEATKDNPGAEIGDELVEEQPLPDEFGRVAAQTAKQVIIQKLREAERETLFNEYKDRAGEIVNATVHRVEGPMVFMDLGAATAMMPPSQQIKSERYNIGDRYKVMLMSVEKTNRGPEILASRAASEMVEKLFEMEVPEIGNEAIEVKGVAREAGSRTKIAVHSLQDNIDPIGSCVGQRGSRVQTVMGELGGEKIDIIEWNEDTVQYIVNALSPAKVISVSLDEEEQQAKAHVMEDQLSLAIGKGGQNVRLAAKLTGWRIDIVKDESGATGEEVEAAEESEESADSERTPEEALKEAAEEVEAAGAEVEEGADESAEEVVEDESDEKESDDESKDDNQE